MKNMLFYFSEGKKNRRDKWNKRSQYIPKKSTNVLKCLGGAYFQNEDEPIGTQTW